MRRVLLLAALLALSFSIGQATAQQNACLGSPPIRLAVGDFGRVTQTTPGETAVPVRVRDVPGKSGNVVGQIGDGDLFQVIDGPTCKDNYAWWKIQAQGVQGWVAEGDSSGYFVEPAEQPTPTSSVPVQPTATLPPVTGNAATSADRFAIFNPGPVDTAGSLPPYLIAPDFSNIVLTAPLSSGQLDVLRRNGFVISPGQADEFYTVYQQARANNQPLYITTDSLLHAYDLAFEKVISSTESHALAPLLRTLNTGLLIEADKLYQALAGTDWQDAAARSVAYIGVGARLLDTNTAIPGYASDRVAREIANITSGGGIGPSAIFPDLADGEDWSAYIVRGHYAASDDLKAYYQAMTYYGRMVFHLNQSDETKTALLLAVAVRDANVNGRAGRDVWSDVYDTALFFSGTSAGLTISQYIQAIDQVYGANADARAIQSQGVDAFVASARSMSEGAVIPVNPMDRGLHFMAPHADWDVSVFDQMTSQSIGTSKNPRNLPSALDFFSALGWDRAFQILDKQGQTRIENYTNQLNQQRSLFASPDESTWTQTLYGTWLYTLKALNQPAPGGFPSFMGNQGYADRMLFGALSSFTELKNDTVLDLTPAAPVAAAPTPVPQNPSPAPALLPNYVEPVPVFWARLAALAEMTRVGLAGRQLLDDDSNLLLKRLSDLARRFEALSVKEIQNQPLSADENTFLAGYSDQLAKLLLASSNQPGLSVQAIFDLPPDAALPGDVPQAAVVTTLAADPKGTKLLQVGTGSIYDMYVAVPVGTQIILAHGAIFSYHEFEQAAKNRFTDDSWRAALNNGKVSPIPGWTFSFMAPDSADPGLAAVIRDFQQTLVDDLWYSPRTTADGLHGDARPVSQYLISQLDPLANASQTEARQIVQVHFAHLTSDQPNKATLETVETWRGALYNADETGRVKIAERGPYLLHVSYQLGKDANGVWTITDLTVQGDPPGWSPVN